MADLAKRLPTNIGGNFFVDSTCINCDTCRQLAPATFVEHGDYSSVYHQPASDSELRAAYQALIACPVRSIGTVQRDKAPLQAAMADFPLALEHPVYYNGFNSEKSFGANSYFIQHPDGNWLIDSPRYVRQLVTAFERMGGIRYILLTHEDDVADSDRYAKQFGATRIIHRADADAAPGAEWIVEGDKAVRPAAQVEIIPVPGHTEGSLALLYDARFLLTGDHLWWDRDIPGFALPSFYVWNEQALRRSAAKLLDLQFEWVLPGHGDRIHLPAGRIRQEVQLLLERRTA